MENEIEMINSENIKLLDYVEMNTDSKRADIIEVTDNINESVGDWDLNYSLESSGEYADGMIDIYYHDIYESVGNYSDDINEALEQGLVTTDSTIDKIIQAGQYFYHEREYSSVCHAIDDYILELE